MNRALGDPYSYKTKFKFILDIGQIPESLMVGNFTIISTESVFQPQFNKSSTNKENLQRPEECKHKREFFFPQWHTGIRLREKE